MDAVTPFLAERLLSGSLQGAGIIALVWVTTRLVPRIPAAVQSALWWLAALKLVLAFAPMPALPIPVLPAEPWTSTAVSTPTIETGTAMPSGSGTLENTTFASPRRPWVETLIVLWVAVLLIQTARLLKDYGALRAVIRRSTPWPEDGASVVVPLARVMGLRRLPRIATSDEVSSPQVAGIVRPIVLLPRLADALTPDERTMMLCHELMHIRRRDLALGWVPALAERLFFFHPLARLAAREYVTSREAACDAAVVRALDLPPADYGRLLIRLGIATSPPVLVAGGSPPSTSSLKRRLQMLQHTGSLGPSRGWRWLTGAVVLALVPIQLVARTPSSAQVRSEAAPPPGSAAAPVDVPERAVAPRAVVPAPGSAPRAVAPAAPSPRVVTPAVPSPQAAAPAAPLPRAVAPAALAPRAVAPASPASPARSVQRLQDDLRAVEPDIGAMLAAIEAAQQRDRAEQLTEQEKARRQASVDAMLDAIAEQTRANRREAEVRGALAAESARRDAEVTAHIEALTQYQEALAVQVREIRVQQDRLVEAQRQLAQAAEQLRKALEAR